MITISKLCFVIALAGGLLSGCGNSDKPAPLREYSEPEATSGPTPVVRSWKFNTYTDSVTQKQVNAISLISGYADLGDFTITCDAGSSSMKFVSAKPITPKGKLAYRIGDSKPTKLAWTHTISNGFTLFTSNTESHISMLKALYVNTDFYVSTIDPGGYNSEIQIGDAGLKGAINLTRSVCGWKESDFPPYIQESSKTSAQ
jgi:hypothetical protein